MHFYSKLLHNGYLRQLLEQPKNIYVKCILYPFREKWLTNQFLPNHTWIPQNLWESGSDQNYFFMLLLQCWKLYTTINLCIYSIGIIFSFFFFFLLHLNTTSDSVTLKLHYIVVYFKCLFQEFNNYP